MVQTVTICNSGTAYDENNEDLIANLFRVILGRHHIEKFICAGPGSTSIGRHTYDPFKMRWPDGTGYGTVVMTGVTSVWNTGYEYGGLASGTGMAFNVEQMSNWLLQMRRTGQRPVRINMVGWSRGAVTCIRMANQIWKDQRGLTRVNIFAVDPVPGPGNFEDENTTLPPCVDNYVEVLMADEARSMMVAADVKRQRRSNIPMLSLVMPGLHADGVEKSGDNGGEVADIVEYLAMHFLARCGTRIMPNPLTEIDVLRKYSKLIIDTMVYLRNTNAVTTPDSYYNVTGDTPTTRFVRRDVEETLPGRVFGDYWTRETRVPKYRVVKRWIESGNGYFINPHHEALFKKHYPLVYHLAKEGEKKLDQDLNTTQMKSMFKRLDDLERKDPLTMQSLEVFASIKQEALDHMWDKRFWNTDYDSTPDRVMPGLE